MINEIDSYWGSLNLYTEPCIYRKTWAMIRVPIDWQPWPFSHAIHNFLNFCLLSVPEPCTPHLFRGVSCYWLYTIESKYTEARTACQKQGGDLVTIETLEEQEFVVAQFNLENGYIDFWCHTWAAAFYLRQMLSKFRAEVRIWQLNMIFGRVACNQSAY